MTDMEKIDYTIEEQYNSNRHHKQFHHVLEEDLDDIIEPKIGIWHWLLSFLKSEKRIGELNGHWAFLFKFLLLVLLFVIPTIGTWGLWITKQVISGQFHVQQTESYEQRISTLERFCERNTVSTVQLDNRIAKIETTNDEQNRKLDTLEDNNASEHAKILIILESMKATLDILKTKG